MAVGTDHDVLRVYDINTAQCFVSAIPSQQHKSSVTCVKYAPTAKVYATGSLDGSIKLWDAISGRCINTFDKAHDGAEVCSVVFSRNGKVRHIQNFLPLRYGRGQLNQHLFKKKNIYFSVFIDIGQGFAGEIVGAEHESLFDCVHWCWNDGQTGAQYSGHIQSQRRLRSVSGRGDDVVVLVELTERIPVAFNVAGPQRTRAIHRSFANTSGISDVLGRFSRPILVPASHAKLKLRNLHFILIIELIVS